MVPLLDLVANRGRAGWYTRSSRVFDGRCGPQIREPNTNRGDQRLPQIKLNGVELNVVDRGSGRPILFVHGFALDHRMWLAQIEEFAPSHRVIAPDLRGFGKSSATPGTASMRQFAHDLNVMLDARGVDEPICFCGLSMGGYVAWPFLRSYAARVSSLVLCDTRATPDTEKAAQQRRTLAEAILKLGSAAASDVFLPLLFTRGSAPENFEKVRQMITDADPHGLAAALHGMAERPDCTDQLTQIDVPTLVICGTEDRITPLAEVRAMADAIPGAQFVELPGIGHVTPMEHPAAVNTTIRDFLHARS
jgi:pimeloyl-ACP methyl ester carboxylesterase